MGFDISALSNPQLYAAQIDEKIFTKAVGDSKTADLLTKAGSVVFGMGRTPIRTLDLDVNLQSAVSACSRNPLGNVQLGNAIVNITRVKDEKNLCFESLENTYFQLLTTGKIVPGEDGAIPTFANEITTLRVAKVAEVVEKLLWQGISGATSSYGSDYLNMTHIDGILKQISTTYSTVTATGSTMRAKVSSAVLSQQVKNYSSTDYVWFMGQDDYNAYLNDLASANLFVPALAETIWGTTVKIAVVPGLNGTHKQVGTRLSNLRLGRANQDQLDKMDIKFHDGDSFVGWKSDMFFGIGITVINPSEVAYYVYS